MNRYNITTRTTAAAANWKPWQNQQTEDFPLIHHQGTDYHLVTDDAMHKLRGDREGRIWLMTGFCLMVFASGFALMASYFKPETKIVTVEKPIIVEREKVVPTACLLFCK